MTDQSSRLLRCGEALVRLRLRLVRGQYGLREKQELLRTLAEIEEELDLVCESDERSEKRTAAAARLEDIRGRLMDEIIRTRVAITSGTAGRLTA
jgi:hypothetical protein